MLITAEQYENIKHFLQNNDNREHFMEETLLDKQIEFLHALIWIFASYWPFCMFNNIDQSYGSNEFQAASHDFFYCLAWKQ